jgi:cephalosporin-C deacetylase-like acetyl esterase
MNRRATLAAVCLLVAAATAIAQAEPFITPSARLPKTSPWNLEELAQVPAVEWIDKEGPVRSLLYAGEPYGGKPTRVFAYYATPGSLAGDASLDKDLPAVVLIHGGGGTAFREWAELWAKRGYAAIAMDTAGHRPIDGKNAHDGKNRTRLDDGGPNQGDDEKFGSVDKEPGEQWPYHAVAAAIRAHSLVRSFPEVDRDRTAVTGISWGGYLTCIVAGVDTRFKAAVPVYGCGFLAENSCWLDRFSKMTPAQRERWTALWDPQQYLPAVTMPILFVNGTNDFAYPLDSYMKSYAAVPGEKQLCVTVNMPHGHQAGWTPQEIGRFIDQQLLGKEKLPALDTIETHDNMVKAKLLNGVPIAKAELHFTTDTNEINKRKWQSKPAIVNEAVITAAELPEDATAWFITVRDERGAVVSSRVEFRK